MLNMRQNTTLVLILAALTVATSATLGASVSYGGEPGNQEVPRAHRKKKCPKGLHEVPGRHGAKKQCRPNRRRSANAEWRASANVWSETAEVERTPQNRSVVRRPAGFFSSVTFDDYLNANASHPALNSKVDNHQNAFVDQRKPATISFPAEGSSVLERDAPNPVAEVAPAATPPTSGTTASSSPSH